MRSNRIPREGIGHSLVGEEATALVLFHGRDIVSRFVGMPAVVRSCEVVLIDGPEPLSAFERTDAEYTGVDRRSLPTIGFEDDMSDMRTPWT